jgi:hypothetical protein
MSTTWQSVNKFDFAPNESPALFKQLCDYLNLEQYTQSHFHERLFRHGSFRGYDYDSSYFPSNKIMSYPFSDHSYFFRSKKDRVGNRTIYFVSQPYLDDAECQSMWKAYLDEEEKIIQKVTNYKHNYKAPVLDCVILGKQKSFHYPENTNLIIIGLASDIQNYKTSYNDR